MASQTRATYAGLGSTTALTDDTGAVTDTYEYDVFGNIRAQTGSSANEFTYTGEQVDSADLQYLRARYYDPAVGRFLSQDPLPLLQRYPYVGNNPANLVDPSGLCGVGGWGDFGYCFQDVALRPVHTVQDTIDYIDVMIDHPGSGSRRQLGSLSLPHPSETASRPAGRCSTGTAGDHVGYSDYCQTPATLRLAISSSREATLAHRTFSTSSFMCFKGTSTGPSGHIGTCASYSSRVTSTTGSKKKPGESLARIAAATSSYGR